MLWSRHPGITAAPLWQVVAHAYALAVEGVVGPERRKLDERLGPLPTADTWGMDEASEAANAALDALGPEG